MNDLNLVLDEIRKRAISNIDSLKKNFNLDSDGNPWPQTYFTPVSDGSLNLYPNYRTRGFLPPEKIAPYPTGETYGSGEYTYKDWRGYQLQLREPTGLSIKDKFNERNSLPDSRNSLVDKNYSTRDYYIIFGDRTTDYFRHGLQVIDNLGTLDGVEIPNSTIRYDTFKHTPFENNDPIIYGFDIVVDNLSSPLLNGSINDFINNYSNVSEIASRANVYEDFKQQFSKIFKTKTDLDINVGDVSITNMKLGGSYATSEETSNKSTFGKRAYLGYYLNGVSGLSNLVENNTSNKKKYLASYNEDVITLNFLEDVSMSIGTLAHLYKLLYWSKPNGKGLIPENLLRFNCDIVISEIRNFKRVMRSLETNDLEIVKDNVSRHVYSLKECQFYFNTIPHPDEVNIGETPKIFENYKITFDYKYSSSRLERFVPKNTRGEGKYVSYDSGSMWRIGNPGERDNRSNGVPGDASVPRFIGDGVNTFNSMGVDSNFVLSYPLDKQNSRELIENNETTDEQFRSSLSTIKRASNINNVIYENNKKEQISIGSTSNIKANTNKRSKLLFNTLNKVDFENTNTNNNRFNNIIDSVNQFTGNLVDRINQR